MTDSKPAAVTADRSKQTLTITWADGHTSGFPFDGLRAVCPCVECKGGHAHMGAPPDPIAVRDAPSSELNLHKVEAVGSYALQFHWTDGHSTGIYTWDYLRAACPCRECAGE